MCGIAGRFEFSGNVVDVALVQSMCGTIVHRGPDDQGVYTAPYIGLGQRRLAIIDLDHRAAAPMANEDGSIWITYNGEVYNFRELRADLEEKGHRFRTEGDTEVIVHLYEEYGVDCVLRMRGMFAFAIWDARRKRLFAARDRLGKKPFFFTNTGRALVFGSEIKAILANPDVAVAPNLFAIDEYLTYQYVPSPLTAFEGIEKLPPAHTLVCDANGNVRIDRYWAPPVTEKTAAPAEEIEEELRSRIQDAVRMRLVSDVPVGAFLSGGIDSSTVVAFMSRVSPGRVRTFSIGFDERSHDELPQARIVAARYGTEHHEMIVRPQAADVLPLLVHHFNEPFADSSALPTYYVSKLTREQVTVALSGDGGDENFAGYRSYAAVSAWSRADVLPASLRRMTGNTVSALLDRLPYTNAAARASRAFHMLGANLPERFGLHSMILKPQEKQAAYSARFKSLLQEKTTAVQLPWNEGMDALDWMMRHDQSHYLADCLMVKTDVASMASSLEVRCPFLDHELVEYCATIPSGLKRTAAGGKAILKTAMRGIVPDEILEKPKRGFSLPVAAWFRGELAPLVRSTLLDDRFRSRGLFDASFVARLVEDHIEGRRDYANRIWALLFLELWFREWID
jgi:asparagine synthase (glutamine-hydrolysing)